MEKVTIANIESTSPPDEAIPDGMMAESVGNVRQLSDALDTTGFAVNHYELAPGESFTVSSHFHSNQEEVFYVLSGTVTFDTDIEEVTVDAGELLCVPPRTFQLGTNRGDEPATAIVLGAPRGYEDGGQWKLECEECGDYTGHALDELETGEEVYRCTDCGTVFS